MSQKGQTTGKLLCVQEAQVQNVGKGIAAIHSVDMNEMGLSPGDLIEIIGTGRAVGKVVPITPATDEYKGKIQLDGLTRENAGVGLDYSAQIRKTSGRPAHTLLLSSVHGTESPPDERDAERVLTALTKLPVMIGNKIELSSFGTCQHSYLVEGTIPQGAVVITPDTIIKFKPGETLSEEAPRVSYEDIGGLQPELQKIRELIEYPMKYPEIFARLGIDPPKGVLLVGSSGVGKTLIIRAIAHEAKAHFVHLNGPEIMNKFYGESEARLRQVFEEASEKAPSIVFIDEIDAIVPKRTEAVGNVEKRVVAQLLVLMDGLVSRGNVVVIGATNAPGLLDPALRRPGRFDREITINAPNRIGRLEILRIHTRRMPLHNDVDLAKISELTHGFVGADLAALVKEAGMVALRRFCSQMGNRGQDLSELKEMQLRVEGRDFLNAYKEIEPTALREFLPERPGVKLANVGGLKDVKKILLSLIQLCLRSPDSEKTFRRALPGGFFFVGRPGTGKTLMARAIAGELDIPLISVYSSALFSRWVGESERVLEDIFRRAKQVAPCVLLFDEIDSIAPVRSGKEDSGVSLRMVNQLIREIDKIKDIKEAILIAATNRMDLVDPALLAAGRFDYVMQFGAPNEEECEEIFEIYGTDLGLESIDVGRLARMCRGFSGADIENVCKRVRLATMEKGLTIGDVDGARGVPGRSIEDFKDAVDAVRNRIRLTEGLKH